MTDTTALLRALIKAHDAQEIAMFADAVVRAREFLAAAPTPADARPCTCHPDDNPPVPCPRKYALSECRAAAPTPDVHLTDDDALRFACRVLESDAPEADRQRARDGLMAIRQRVRDAAPQPVAWVECNGDLVWADKAAAIGRNLYVGAAPPARTVETPAQSAVDPVAKWDGKCAMGHCGFPSACERDDVCYADAPPARADAEDARWQPIETAPKHYAILAVDDRPFSMPYVAVWLNNEHPSANGEEGWFDSWNHDAVEPKKWMPLPFNPFAAPGDKHG